MQKKCAILIPALDPPEQLKTYIAELIRAGFSAILLVDDGSTDKSIFAELSGKPEITVLSHDRNYGKGRALRTGFRYYKEHFPLEEYIGVITADSDGQHLTEDVVQIQKKLLSGTDKMILGCRDFQEANVPPKSRFGNTLTSRCFKVLLGLSVSDTQTGLRGIPNSLMDLCLSVQGDRFEYETAVLMKTGKTAGFEEVPIHTVYFDKNQGTHFHPIRDSFLIYRLLLGTFFIYLLSSLSSTLIDFLLFTLCDKLLLRQLAWRIPASTIAARLVSGTFNYLVNRNVVFQSRAGYAVSAASYFLLCAAGAVVSSILVTALTAVLPVDEILIKMFVDTALFFVNYLVQKTFIFKNK
ncbi:MAG: bifunctional glycosyltransferase family 2/GtrA family protein [Lachnospiraceae bacterium]|nr:bifunctional glycosyltransferase family 2/GtrA family protein [Lachnospiraceae bacterium]